MRESHQSWAPLLRNTLKATPIVGKPQDTRDNVSQRYVLLSTNPETLNRIWD